MKASHLKFVLFLLLVVGALVSVKLIGFDRLNAWLLEFFQYVRGLGFSGILLYGVVFGIASMLALPALPLTVGAGVIFGFAGGLGASMLGIFIGGGFGFAASRYLARDEVSARLRGHPKFQAIDTAIGNEGWKIVGLLRMCPIPFGLSNYLYGLTSVGFWPYMLATAVGVLPGISFFVYLGAAGKASFTAAGKMTDRPAGMFVLLGVGLVAGVVAMVYVGKVARAAVAKATTTGPAVTPGELTEIK